jgi:hypothetical protein
MIPLQASKPAFEVKTLGQHTTGIESSAYYDAFIED